MSPKKRGKIPKHSRVFSVKSLEFFSRIPNSSPAASPANPFLLPCISSRRLVHGKLGPLPCRRSSVLLPPSVELSELRPSGAPFQDTSLGFAGFSSSLNRFRALRFSAMSSSTPGTASSEIGTRSGVGAILPIEVIGQVDHPSYSNCFPAAVQHRLFPIHSLPSTKDKKASASVGTSAAPSSAPVKSKKRKASSAPSRPIQSSRERKYSTRSSSRLVSSFSNTDDDPVDLVSSPPGLGDDDDSSGDEDAGNPQGSPTTEELIDDYSLEERNTGLVPESDPPCIPSDLSSRRARFQQLERSAINVDFGFSDAGTSTSSQLIRSVPSVESLSFAKAAVRNFLELGLHQLGETQRLAMISAVSILRVAPEFSSDSSLLENVATIFSDSDAAQARSTSLMAKVEDFHYKRRKAEGMEQENSSVRAQIQNLTTEYDTNEDEVKRLEEKILEHRAKMASHCHCCTYLQ
ncbi:hypothetical protein F511_37901 [Dorcoceras hygrometricum]|uniref:Uncharacterized protein n=1 Tax=Dorcoceras hygrometricum TaxID=472368 RepID=A0A2Z7BWM3_9LAMI|nr:hypothetical protein F511_37901 [Dorcoceras hygrometricum]